MVDIICRLEPLSMFLLLLSNLGFVTRLQISNHQHNFMGRETKMCMPQTNAVSYYSLFALSIPNHRPPKGEFLGMSCQDSRETIVSYLVPTSSKVGGRVLWVGCTYAPWNVLSGLWGSELAGGSSCRTAADVMTLR